MAVLLNTGLSDLSKELGETTVNQTTNRIKHYNDAVIDFFKRKKWNFALKRYTGLTTTNGTQRYSLAGITNMRDPGGIKEIFIGTDSSSNLPWTPVNYEDRFAAGYVGQKYFYIDEETNEVVFLGDITTTGDTITIRYWHIPARIEDINDATGFPLPDRFRKEVALAAAAFVQWARYLGSEGNAKWTLYERMVSNAEEQQNERNRGNIRRLANPLAFLGFRRTYPNQSRRA